MKKSYLCLILLVSSMSFTSKAFSQQIGVKTNTLYLATTTFNAGFEFAINHKNTIELAAAYNPWTFSDDKKMRFWLLQPEWRRWICEKFEGHFWGIHLHGAQYYGGFNKKRYDGYLLGGGLSYGYAHILSPRWNLETVIGVGYARLWYDESARVPCLGKLRNRTKDYFGITKLSMSFVYIF